MFPTVVPNSSCQTAVAPVVEERAVSTIEVFRGSGILAIAPVLVPDRRIRLHGEIITVTLCHATLGAIVLLWLAGIFDQNSK